MEQLSIRLLYVNHRKYELMEGIYFMQITFCKQIEELRHKLEAHCRVTPKFLSKIEVENLVMGV